MRGYPTILLMQAQECLCPLNNLRLIGLGPAQVEQCPRNQLATPHVCHQCVAERWHHAGALHQVERVLAGVGTPEYDRLLRQSLQDAEAVLVLNPITAAMLEPYASRVRIVPWGIEPARFPWPADEGDLEHQPGQHRIALDVNPGDVKADEIDAEPQPGRHHTARDVNPGMTADGATLPHASEPRGGDIILPGAGRDVAPSGLDGEEECEDALRFPGFPPRAIRSRPSRASETPHAVDSIAARDDETGARPGARTVTTLFIAAVAGETIKGFHIAHEACRILRETRSDFELVVTFDPPGQIDEVTRSIGWCSQAALPAHYRAADIVLVPTIAQDALSITSVEAMAAGKPVIASRIGGLPYTVTDGLTGLLFNPGNPFDLAEKIGRLLDDPELRQTMGLAGRKRFEDDFMWDDVIKRYWRPLLPARRVNRIN